MSLRYMLAVLDPVDGFTTTSPTQTLVLLCLADCANDRDGRAWPAVATIARRSRLGERAVQYALRELEALGLLESKQTEGRSTRYRLAFEPISAPFPRVIHRGGAPGAPRVEQGVHAVHPGVHQVHPGVHAVHPNLLRTDQEPKDAHAREATAALEPVRSQALRARERADSTKGIGPPPGRPSPKGNPYDDPQFASRARAPAPTPMPDSLRARSNGSPDSSP